MARLARSKDDPQARAQAEASVADLERKLEVAAQAAHLALNQQAGAMNQSLDQGSVELRRATERLAALQNQDEAGSSQKLAVDPVYRAQFAETMAQLNRLRDRLQDASKTYGPNSPEIKGVNAQIHALEERLIQAFAGKTLVRIDSDAGPLNFKLPVEIGSTLTEAAVEKAALSLPAGYELQYVPVNDHEVELRIVKR
jgi:chromosome segregation ATPase